MLWVGLGLVLFLVLFGYQRWRVMQPLFADAHLVEVAAALPDLKRRALSAKGAAPKEPPAAQTAHLTVSYSISRDGEVWVHHVSVSTRLTPANAAGAFFLGLARGLLHLDAAPPTAFVSRQRVFHMMVRLSDEQQQAFAATAVEPHGAEELRTLAFEGRSVILPRLGTAELPLPTPRV